MLSIVYASLLVHPMAWHSVVQSFGIYLGRSKLTQLGRKSDYDVSFMSYYVLCAEDGYVSCHNENTSDDT